jgi:putative transposase
VVYIEPLSIQPSKVENITEELCGKKFSKSTVSALCKTLDPIVHAFKTRPLESHYPFLIVDALYLKVREDSRVRSRGLLIAIGVGEKGYREIIGFQVSVILKVKAAGENSSHPLRKGV